MEHKELLELQLKHLNEQNPGLAKEIASRYGLNLPSSQPRESPPQQINQNPMMLNFLSQFNKIVMEPLGHEDYSRITRIFNSALIGNGGNLSETITGMEIAFFGFLQSEDGKDIIRMAVSGFLKDFGSTKSQAE